MNDFDDFEIIDLEDEPEETEKNEEEIQNDNIFVETPQKKESTPLSFNKNNFFNKKNDNSTASKLQNINNKNILFPNKNLTENNKEEESKNKVEEVDDKVKTKVGTKAIEAYTGGLIHGKTAETVADIATKMTDRLLNNYKKYAIIGLCTLALFITLVCILLISSSDDSDVGQNTYTYVTGETTEEELFNELKYYGYCKDESSCKDKGIYKFYTKLKDLYEEYQKPCPTDITNDKPCGITLNTGLIIETINYYQNSSSAFDAYDNEEDEDTDLSLSSWFSSLFQAIRNKKKINGMLDDVENLALAEAEYVKEICENETYYYYQISFNKYVSYLKYGNTSSHPNYSGQPVEIENEICQGKTNDNISNSFDSRISDSNDN